MSGFQPRSISLAAASDKNESLLIPGSDTGNQRRISPVATGDQPARLDRAGSQTRTRLSPTRFIRARRENEDSDLRALGENWYSANR